MEDKKTAFVDLSVKHLFATPLVVASLPPEEYLAINAALNDTILKREQESKSVIISNRGGWQSDTKVLEWGGPPVQKVLSAITDLLKQVTLHLENNTYSRVNLQWRVEGWANINRKGDNNAVHTHPGAYWSAVYYVRVDDIMEENKTVGGELELMDPRGVLPILYCPNLRFGIQGYTTAGTSELHKPRAGQCVLFPSWLPHAVVPYIGAGTRISIALNFSV